MAVISKGFFIVVLITKSAQHASNKQNLCQPSLQVELGRLYQFRLLDFK